jgi:hypothetical protein
MKTQSIAAAFIVALACGCKRDAQPSTTTDTTRPDAVNSDAGKAGQVPPTANAVTFDGIGRARIGSAIAQLRDAGPVPDAKPGETACRIVHLDWMPAGTRVMLTRDTLARIDVDSSSQVRTIDGAGNGDPETRIHQLYPNVRTQPDKYVAIDHDLIVSSPNDPLRQIIFDTDGKTVKRYRIGRQPEVSFVEGCG